MLDRREELELARLTRRVGQVNGDSDKNLKRKLVLESRALQGQIIKARYEAKYPALAIHLKSLANPFCKSKREEIKTLPA